MTTNQALSTRELVSSFIKALNEEDFATARSYVHDNFSFDGVLGARDSADAYFKDMEKMRFKYDIKKIFTDGDDVCLLYDINMQGTSIFTCGWYKVQRGKIQSLKVVFDPRPILEKK
jgi:limonene-1,2-epoxide hydrolase